ATMPRSSGRRSSSPAISASRSLPRAWRPPRPGRTCRRSAATSLRATTSAGRSRLTRSPLWFARAATAARARRADKAFRGYREAVPVREATAEDVDAVFALLERRNLAVFGESQLEPRWIEYTLAQNGCDCLVAEDEGRVTGWASLDSDHDFTLAAVSDDGA